MSGWVEGAPAILPAVHLGLEGPAALARILSGAVNPGGRLPLTSPRGVGQVPIALDDLHTGRPRTEGSMGPSAPDVALQGPGNLVDHFTSKYLDLPLGPKSPFGHGLSYTRFELEAALATQEASLAGVIAGGRIEVTVSVRNAGDWDGCAWLGCRLTPPGASRTTSSGTGGTDVDRAPGASTSLRRRGARLAWRG